MRRAFDGTLWSNRTPGGEGGCRHPPRRGTERLRSLAGNTLTRALSCACACASAKVRQGERIPDRRCTYRLTATSIPPEKGDPLFVKRTTLVLCLLLAACGDGSSSDPTPEPVACSFEARDGFCEPATDDLGRPMVCERGACVPTWEGRCSPELGGGTCYDPAFPIPPTPLGYGLNCCDGECVAGRGCP